MSKILFLVSPSLNSFADKQKGTTGNKIDCAFQHYKNSTVSNMQIATVAGTTALIGRMFAKKLPETVAKLEGKGIISKFVEYFKAAPKPVKAVAYALMGLSLLVRTYNKGTIEQKYIDRAQFVDRTYTLDAPENEKKASAPLKK